ncbi:amidohydrolase family protein [Paenibacillus tarimensis]
MYRSSISLCRMTMYGRWSDGTIRSLLPTACIAIRGSRIPGCTARFRAYSPSMCGRTGCCLLEQAVRKLTSFPAQRFKLGKRGLLAPGYAADAVIFNPDTIQDEATYREPKRYPGGIGAVIVGGVPTMMEGRHTQARQGVLIKAAHANTW